MYRWIDYIKLDVTIDILVTQGRFHCLSVYNCLM